MADLNLVVEKASFSYGEQHVFEDISFRLQEENILCLLGPNGAGKSTLIQCLDRLIPLKSGRILMDGRDTGKFSRRELAQKIAYIAQSHTAVFPFLVRDIVAMGRTPHLGVFSSPGKQDRKRAMDELESLGIGHLAEKPYTELSGGERQLVLFASVVVQEPELLLLDEPTSHLDFGNQMRVLEVIKKLAQKGLSVIMATHSPEHAFLCADYTAIMSGGMLTAWGSPKEVITEKNIRDVYGVDVRIIPLSSDGKEQACVPLLSKTPSL